jgi:DNA-binding PadR family transcriptional regulator
MAQRPLGSFSYLVMRTIQNLPPRQCYGLRIEQDITARLKLLKQAPELAQVYVTLKRLQAKHFIIGTKTTSPNGNKHKVTRYRITATGQQAIDDAAPFYRALQELQP